MEGVTISVDWSGLASARVQHVNQFIVQVGPPTLEGPPDGVYLALGHLSPPLIIGKDAEAQARELEALKDGVPIEILGRFHLSRVRLDELIKVLQETVDNYDKADEQYRQHREQRGSP